MSATVLKAGAATARAGSLIYRDIHAPRDLLPDLAAALARGLGEPEHLLAFYGEAARERIRRVAPGSRAALALAAPDFMRK